MPTRNRRRFIGQAIWYFLRQDYPHKELVIVDDGEERVADLVPADERIRYVRQERRLALGAKRNLACELSRGELIAHWDDDDWSAPQRLSVQVAQLLAADAEVCGMRDVLHYKLDAGEGWLYRYDRSQRPWVAGCTLLYRRAAWADHPFPALEVGEDSAFLRQFPAERLHAVDDLTLHVALIHGANAAAKHLAGAQWQRRPLEEVTRLLAYDRDFYARLRNGRSSLPAGAPRGAGSVTLGAAFNVASGYGSMAEYLALGMRQAGGQVNLVPLSLERGGLSAELQELLAASRPDPAAPVLYFYWVAPELERFRAAPELFVNTMWESSRLPGAWAEALNRARAVIVPTRFVAEVCRASGVQRPIEIIPEGIDPAVYSCQERPERAGLTTLIVGPVDERKHTREAIAAWRQAFADDPEARLLIKDHYRYHNYQPDDPRIHYIATSEPTRGIAHWYREADALLALGSEGFGLPLVEGMASGLPVIALNSEGQGDVCEEAAGLVLPVAPARWERAGPHGVRAVPDVEQAAAQLRWVASHRDEARAMGRAASAWALERRSIWAKGPAVLDAMERHLRAPRPLRRAETLWVPSWGSACGVAEYTGHLLAGLAGAQVTSAAPEPGRLRLLHVQHEPSLFDEQALSRHCSQLRQARVPLAITEHAVTQQAHAWEREADVLVSLTERGAARLRRRWPGKRVEHIPPGCPTWFPPRKKERGLVIGAFGFLGRHKGFWQLLDALRALPGSELLLFSHAKYPGVEASWERDAAGLPVRRVGAYLPVEEIARRLAAEADLLVFWYEEVAQASASYAVRIGLASGVPVLASPTSWFAELREATYQPADLVEGVRRLLEDTPLRQHVTSAAYEYCQEHCWAQIAERHRGVWRSLEAS